MDKKDLRIVYMGTPEFAVESLRRLVEGGYNVVGVITMPDITAVCCSPVWSNSMPYRRD